MKLKKSLWQVPLDLMLSNIVKIKIQTPKIGSWIKRDKTNIPSRIIQFSICNYPPFQGEELVFPSVCSHWEFSTQLYITMFSGSTSYDGIKPETTSGKNKILYLYNFSMNTKLFKNLKVYWKNIQVLTTDSLARAVLPMTASLIATWKDAFVLVSPVLCIKYSKRPKVVFSHWRQQTKASA